MRNARVSLPIRNSEVRQGATASNIDAPRAVRLYEVWADWTFGASDASMRFGLYDLNSEFDTTEARSLFMNSTFGVGHELGQTGHNGPSIFPSTSLALRMALGQHGFWQGEEAVRVAHLDLREQVLDVQGQEIMTADKVTLRLNALVIHRVTDPEKAVTEVGDHTQALYRQAQLALRALVGTRELDALLADKDGVARELEETLRARAARFGVEVASAGIRDVILPGEMKEILNRVTEARKAAEAALVTRREETAAMRSQANTAKIFESNPTLMKLRELEVLEKVAEKSDLTVVLGDGGLAERVVKML
jgi:hypothetical protein